MFLVNSFHFFNCIWQIILFFSRLPWILTLHFQTNLAEFMLCYLWKCTCISSMTIDFLLLFRLLAYRIFIIQILSLYCEEAIHSVCNIRWQVLLAIIDLIKFLKKSHLCPIILIDFGVFLNLERSNCKQVTTPVLKTHTSEKDRGLHSKSQLILHAVTEFVKH